MSDIIKLVPKTSEATGPDAEVIERIEELLERARRGDIVGIAYAVIEQNNGMGTGWCGGHGTRDRIGMAVGILNHRYISAVIEADS